MDLAAFWSDLGKLGVVVAMMAVALRWMVLRMHALEDKHDKREAEARAECLATNRELADRLRKLEDETRNEGRQDRVKLVECVHRSTRVLELIADKLPPDPPNGRL